MVRSQYIPPPPPPEIRETERVIVEKPAEAPSWKRYALIGWRAAVVVVLAYLAYRL